MDPNWPVRMGLPWDTLNSLTKEALETGKRLSPAAKKELVHTVVDSETLTPGEIQSSSKTESPVLVVFGDSVLSGRSITVMYDHVILCPRSDSFIDTFSAFFACFYIFNLEYPQGAASTLEFIQRCFVGINPDRGSKGNKGKKKKTLMSSKVLKLINDLSDFEWLQT